MTTIGYSYGSAWIGGFTVGRTKRRPLLPRIERGHHEHGGGRWVDLTWLGLYVGRYGIGR